MFFEFSREFRGGHVGHGNPFWAIRTGSKRIDFTPLLSRRKGTSPQKENPAKAGLASLSCTGCGEVNGER
jgi:hypothetical protein